MPNHTLNEATARSLLDQIKASLDEMRDAIIRLWEGQGWLALGYDSWHDMCKGELSLKLQLPMMDRISIVHGLTGHSMSTRAIGSALGISQSTVTRDRRSGEPNDSPAKITGVDRKRYRIHIPLPAEPQEIHATVSIDAPREPIPVPPPKVHTDPGGSLGTIDRVAEELLVLLGRTDASRSSRASRAARRPGRGDRRPSRAMGGLN